MELDPHFVETIIERYLMYTETDDVTINTVTKTRDERKDEVQEKKSETQGAKQEPAT